MPIPAAVIAAGISAASAGAQSAATGNMNRKSRKFQEKMFDRTNQYNAPKEQMKRLAEAGLNPHLVYGGSSGGTAGTATQPAKPDFETPEFGKIGEAVTDGVQAMYNQKAIKAGIDVNEARAENIKSDTVNKGIDAVNKAIKAASGSLDYKTKNALYKNTLETAQAKLRNLGIQGTYTSNKDIRENRITNETVKKLRAETGNISEDAKMKRIDAALYKDYGIRPNDPSYYRIISKVLQELGLNFNTFKK